MRKRKQIYNPVSGKFDLISIDGAQGDTLGNGIEASTPGIGAVDFQMNRSSEEETAKGNYSACLGSENQAGGPYSMAIGSKNRTSYSNSFAMGMGSKDKYPYSLVQSCGRFVEDGDNQFERFQANSAYTGPGYQDLMDFGEIEAFPQYIVINYRIQIVARSIEATKVYCAKHEGCMYNNGGTINIVDTKTILYNSASFDSRITANGSNFKIEVSLGSGMRVMANVELVNLSFET
jgi:hypothetical protein